MEGWSVGKGPLSGGNEKTRGWHWEGLAFQLKRSSNIKILYKMETDSCVSPSPLLLISILLLLFIFLGVTRTAVVQSLDCRGKQFHVSQS